DFRSLNGEADRDRRGGVRDRDRHREPRAEVGDEQVARAGRRQGDARDRAVDDDRPRNPRAEVLTDTAAAAAAGTTAADRAGGAGGAWSGLAAVRPTIGPSGSPVAGTPGGRAAVARDWPCEDALESKNRPARVPVVEPMPPPASRPRRKVWSSGGGITTALGL